MIVSPQILLEVRTSATVAPNTRLLWNSFNFDCLESSGVQTHVIEDSTTDFLIWDGAFKGKFLLVAASDVISIKLNSIANTAITGEFFMLTSDDVTGITKVYVTNALTDDVTLTFYVSGNVVV